MNQSSDIRDAWERNQRINLALVEHLEPEMLELQTPAGGMTIAQHLAHLCASLKYWSSQIDKASMRKVPDLYDPSIEDDFVVSTDLNKIKEAFQETSAAAWSIAQQAQNLGDLPHKSTGLFLIHMMVHDAHHRGQILLTLKVAGKALPDDEHIWQPWKDR